MTQKIHRIPYHGKGKGSLTGMRECTYAMTARSCMHSYPRLCDVLLLVALHCKSTCARNTQSWSNISPSGVTKCYFLDTVLQDLGLHKAATFLEEFDEFLGIMDYAMRIPADSDDTNTNMALGALLQQVQASFPEANQLWWSVNLDHGATIDRLVQVCVWEKNIPSLSSRGKLHSFRLRRKGKHVCTLGPRHDAHESQCCFCGFLPPPVKEVFVLDAALRIFFLARRHTLHSRMHRHLSS